MIPSLLFDIALKTRINPLYRRENLGIRQNKYPDFIIGGFTLIEILIALGIFAIIATLTTSVISHAFKIRERITQHADKNNQIWASMILLQREIQQIIAREPRKTNMQLVPAFIGKPQYIEFTRGGFMNPGAKEKRSHLKRIAYFCHPPKLVRRTWAVIDTPQRNQFQDKTLVEGIESCHFAYLDQHMHVLNEWQAQAPAPSEQNQATPLFPKAIQFNISFNQTNKISWLAIIPSALYADI